MFERAEAFALERCVIANAALSQELSELWILTEARVPLSVIWGMSVDRTPLVAYLNFATLGRHNRFVTTVNHRRLVKARVFQQTVRTQQAPLWARQYGLAGAGANPNICGVTFAYAALASPRTNRAMRQPRQEGERRPPHDD
jgi:hypothetical protein